MAAQKISFTAEVCFLICLSLYFPLGSAQTFPYITFLGETLANNSYVNLSLVGNDTKANDSVRCHTDLSTCCSGSQGAHRGDWYFPNGTQLPFIGHGTPYEARGAQIVRLGHSNKRTVSGVYRCDIATNAVHDADHDIHIRDTLYVGLYFDGGRFNDGNQRSITF